MANASYFDSSIIKIHPASRRNNPYSRMIAEQGITKPIKHLTPDEKGTFIVTSKIEFDNYDANLEFYIEGYYFNIDHDTVSGLITTDRYNKNIVVKLGSKQEEDSGAYDGFEELEGIDTTDSTPKYTGIQYCVLTASDPTLPSGWTEDNSVKIISNGEINEDELSLKSLFNKFVKPVVVCGRSQTQIGSHPAPEEKVLESQLWVDTVDGGIAKFFNGTYWEGIGAVYKEAQNV